MSFIGWIFIAIFAAFIALLIKKSLTNPTQSPSETGGGGGGTSEETDINPNEEQTT